jgi:hypothetical protein
VALAVKSFIGFRPDTEGEEEGLDQIDHGESGYHLDEGAGMSHPSGEGFGHVSSVPLADASESGD